MHRTSKRENRKSSVSGEKLYTQMGQIFANWPGPERRTKLPPSDENGGGKNAGTRKAQACPELETAGPLGTYLQCN